MAADFAVRAFVVFDAFNAPGGTALSAAELNDVYSYIRDHKALGHNTMSLAWGVPIDPASGSRAAAFGMNTVHEASFDELRLIANYAKSLGLDIILKPHPQSAVPTGTNGTLPDNINAHSVKAFPSFSVATFLKDWAAYMGQVSSLAQELGAKEIVVGSENMGLDTLAYRSLWQDVITAARSKYSGLISYDALYPLERGGGVDTVGFWDLVDIIGVSAYYPLTNKDNPTYADVLAGWYANHIYPNDTGPTVNVVAKLRALSEQYGKPVQFEEFAAQSFHGVVANPTGGGPANKVPDLQQQAWMYQSVLEAFSGDNAGGWFRGIVAWGQSNVPGQDDPRFEGYISTFGQTNFDVRGKEAAKVLAASYGATNHLAYGDTGFVGTTLDDRIALYGRGTDASSKTDQDQTFFMSVRLLVSGTIVNGQAPTLRYFVNGVDYGTQQLSTVPSGYVDAAGVPWSQHQELLFRLPSTTALDQIKVVLESPAAGTSGVNFYVNEASVNNIVLSDLVQVPGSITIGGKAWNDAFAQRSIGTAANPLHIDGGDGTDTVFLLGQKSQYTGKSQQDGSVTLIENSGLGQNAILKNIELLKFADGSSTAVSQLITTHGAAGNRAGSHITRNADGTVTFVDKDGKTSTLSNVEKITFADMTVDLTIPAKAKAVTTAQLDSLVELYIAYFNRVPDAEGLGYWLGELQGGKTLEQIGASFYNAALQFSILTGYSSTMTNADFVKVVYANVLGRSGGSAPPQADVDYWAGNLASGTDTRGSLIKTMLGAAHNFKGHATWGWVADLLDNKLAVGKTFAVGYGLTYLNSADSVAKGMDIAAAVKPDDTGAALALIGITDTPMPY
ncbi:glycoside hydrolase family 113 [Noviherbaspirillum sp.]|uniref:glycoside hydrolase family 113 n=1 Tax=Noviherbaspirillum sp. TaxID=1926288 RepID=UPI002D6AD128|nr:DUF4214 domain-containing protein [Noviherbaspirillum sp.]HZW21920.1 DUF4214 domain-containing protein [Noviherbaspirillum sp.]